MGFETFRRSSFPANAIRKAAICSLVSLAPQSALACDADALCFKDSVAMYGRGAFSAITTLSRCGDYRVFVAYVNGTDMLFMDKLMLVNNESTFTATDGLSFKEFNVNEASNDIETLACKVLDSARVKIFGKVRSGHSDKDFKFTIIVDPTTHSYVYDDTRPK